MNLSGLITFWALLIAGYSVMSEYWRYKAKAFVGLGRLVVAFIVSSTLVIRSTLLSGSDWTVGWGDYRLVGSTACLEVAAFMVLTVFTFWSLWDLQRGKITRRRLSGFQKMLSELQLKKEHVTLTEALKDNLDRLATIRAHKSRWSRLMDRLNKDSSNQPPESVRMKRAGFTLRRIVQAYTR